MFDQFPAALAWMPSGVRHGLLRGVASGLPFEGRRLRSMAEILAISDLPRRFASWYGGFDTELQARVLSDTMRNEIGDGGLAQAFKGIVNSCDSSNALDRFLYCDIHTRLVDDILVKGDRMSMGAGIEARVPFLDHKLVEFAASLPQHLKVSGLSSKIVLKRLAERYIPRETIYRRKVGFTVPLTRWFAGPWRGLIGDVLLSDCCLDPRHYHAGVARGIVRGSVGGRGDRGA